MANHSIRTSSASIGAALALVAVLAAPPVANAQGWTDWTAGSGVAGASGSMDGTLFGSAVSWTGTTFGGQYSNGTTFGGPVSQTGAQGNDYFGYAPNAYNQNGLTVPGLGFIQFNSAGSGTLLFSTAVVNPYLAFVSMGQPSTPVTFYFGNSFTVLSNNNDPNCAYWGCGSYSVSGNNLTGNEFSGTIQFQGTFNSLSFRWDPSEEWHGMTLGADSVVPEPATMSLLATGLVAMAAARRRRKNNA